MKYDNNWDWKGEVEILITYSDGTYEIQKFNNLVMNVGKNLLRDAMKSSTPLDLRIKYLALGSSTTAVVNTQTTLVSEQFRQQVTQQAAGSAGVLTTTTYIAPFDATTFTTNEIGWFAGSTAGPTANSGIMIARVLYTRAKSSLESLTITRTDTLS